MSRSIPCKYIIFLLKGFYLPAGLDRTDELIGYINVLTLDLPAPPKPVRIE